MRLLTCFFILVGFVCRSQDDSDRSGHELGINLRPLVDVAFYSQMPLSFDMTYRKVVKQKWALRITPAYELVEDGFLIEPSGTKVFSDQVDSNANEISYQNTFYKSHGELSCYIGFERSLQFKWSTLNIGAGVAPTLVMGTAAIYNQTFSNDSGSYYENLMFSSYWNSTNDRNFSLKMRPYISWQIPLTERFYLNVQTRSEAVLQFYRIKHPEDGRLGKWTSFELRALPVFGEIGLFWKLGKLDPDRKRWRPFQKWIEYNEKQ
ncbi:MAG: hypothetical protein HUJ25_07790 [Crocinitomicaceae bacterium]|nr:hypothetical protein [Crocinitomicaceae bacterium]